MLRTGLRSVPSLMKDIPPLTSTHRTEPSGRRMRCSLITMPEPRGFRISISPARTCSRSSGWMLCRRSRGAGASSGSPKISFISGDQIRSPVLKSRLKMPSWVASAASRSCSLLSWAAVMAWRSWSMSVPVTSQASTRSPVRIMEKFRRCQRQAPAGSRRRSSSSKSLGSAIACSAAQRTRGRSSAWMSARSPARPVRQVQRLAGERAHCPVVIEGRAFGPHHPDLVRHGVESAAQLCLAGLGMAV